MSRIALIRNALLELLAEHERDGALPTSARFLFYELVQRRILSKEAKGKRRPDQDLHEALTAVRQTGEIPWEWIVDETRSLDDFTGYAKFSDGVAAYLPAIRLDPWKEDVPLILTESRSLAGVLRSLCRQYAISIASTNGQCGGFLHTVILPALHPLHRVLYLGDHDLCGNQIEENTRTVLEREASLLRWERLALTESQVAQYDLPVIVKHDRRYKDGGAHEAVETEALSQRIIVEILRTRLDELLTQPLSRVLEREKRERRKIERLLRRPAA